MLHQQRSSACSTNCTGVEVHHLVAGQPQEVAAARGRLLLGSEHRPRRWRVAASWASLAAPTAPGLAQQGVRQPQRHRRPVDGAALDAGAPTRWRSGSQARRRPSSPWRKMAPMRLAGRPLLHVPPLPAPGARSAPCCTLSS